MHDNLCYLRFLRCLHNQRACNSNIYIFQTDLNIVIFSQLNQTCDSHTLSRICENPGTNIELLSNIWGRRSHSSLISWPFWERKRQGAFCSEVIVFLPPQVSIIFLLAAKAPSHPPTKSITDSPTSSSPSSTSQTLSSQGFSCFVINLWISQVFQDWFRFTLPYSTFTSLLTDLCCWWPSSKLCNRCGRALQNWEHCSLFAPSVEATAVWHLPEAKSCPNLSYSLLPHPMKPCPSISVSFLIQSQFNPHESPVISSESELEWKRMVAGMPSMRPCVSHLGIDQLE